MACYCYGRGKFNTFDFFIQCAEDNALCTLINYTETNFLKCQMFHVMIKTLKGFKNKGSCLFCKHVFKDHVKQLDLKTFSFTLKMKM